MLRFLLAALLVLVLTLTAHAAPPATLAYQGRLATAGGQPITASLGITFRIYDVASGGSALWTETQTGVQVDGGNLAVELGRITPLPSGIFGRQLYLGVQIAGDTEMLPRPLLTAAPYALRAASVARQTIVVSAEGTPAENGSALLAAATAATAATAQNPITLQLDAGSFDLGAASLVVPPYVTLAGQSQDATRLTSSHPASTVRLESNASAHDFTATATGTPPDATTAVIGVLIDTAARDGTPVQNARLERVTGISQGASGATGARWGITACISNSRITDATGIGQGGQFAIGLRADCAAADNNRIEQVVATASGASDGLRGVYLAGSRSTWRNINADVTYAATAITTFGIRVFASTVDSTSLLTDATVRISANDIAQQVTALIDGVAIENANVDLARVRVAVDNTRVTRASGIRISSVTGNHIVRAENLDIAIRGVQVPVGNFSSVDGLFAINAAPNIVRSKIDVHCSAGGTYRCNGVERLRQTPQGLQAGALVLDHVEITTGHDNPADGTAFAYGYDGDGSARITGSTVRALRSAQGENARAVGAAAGADLQVSESTLAIDSIAPPTPDCAVASVGSVELYGNHLVGGTCTDSGGTITCAGNTKRGAGFFASTCP